MFAVDSERAALNQHYEKLRSGKDPNLEMALVNLGIHEKVAAAGVDLFPPGWLYDNQLASNQFTDEMLTEVDGVRELYRPKPELWKPERFEGGNFLHRTHYALFLFGSLGLSGTSRYYLAGHMQVQQARVACALERFRHLHGAYPATLDVLVPVFLPAIPHDALDGRPLRYRVEPGGRFTLYSVGMDGMDNGGVFDPKKAFNQQADWVWGYPLPATAAPVLPTP